MFANGEEPGALAAMVLSPEMFVETAANIPPPYAKPDHRALAGNDRVVHVMPFVLLATIPDAAPVFAKAKKASSPKETLVHPDNGIEWLVHVMPSALTAAIAPASELTVVNTPLP
jgi:hypothetical protein